MNPERWLVMTIGLALCGALGVVAGSVISDPYGLYRGSDKPRLVYGDPRMAKYLLNQRYVPRNFDAILIGPSLSANWNLRGIEKLRVYNNSLNGANSVEQAALARAATTAPGIAVAFVIVHPANTFTHDFKTVNLTPDLRRAALGSVGLWEAYVDMLNIRLKRSRQRFDSAGTEEPEFVPTRMNDNMRRLWASGDRFEVDPIAWAAYAGMARDLRQHNVRIVFVVPPTARDVLEPKRRAFDDYVAMVRREVAGDDDWVNFSAGPYAALCDGGNFTDGVHFTAEAARTIVTQLNIWVAEALTTWNLPRVLAGPPR